MAGLRYSLPGYRNRIRMARHRTLLVEGPSDKKSFQCLFDETRNTGRATTTKVEIDTAEMLMSAEAGVAGNRQLVEAVAHSLGNVKFKEKIVCFVDREFDGFDESGWVDPIADHRVSDRLVWSRGHSMENYYLDFETIRRVLRAVAMTDGFEDAIALFADVFNSVLRAACAIGLAGRDTERFRVIRGSIDETIFDLVGTTVVIDGARWKRRMLRKKDHEDDVAQDVIEAYERWHSQLAQVDPDVIRWMSHGEIALMTVWAGYARCLQQVSGRTTTSPRPYQASEDVRENACAASWAQRALADQTTFPQIVLDMLGFVQVSDAPATPPR